MATIKKYLSPKVVNGTAEIFFRISISRDKVYRLRTGLFVKAERFKNGNIAYPRANQREVAELRAIDNKVAEIERLILDSIVEIKNVERGFIVEIIDKYHHPDKYIGEDEAPKSFFELWDVFLKTRDISANRLSLYKSVARCLHRYEIYRKITREQDFELNIDMLTADDLMDFEEFYRKEWEIYKKFPKIYSEYPLELRMLRKAHAPQKRGDNMVIGMMKKFRAFYNWLYSQEITTNRPFDKYKGKSERYGTPYYLTIEERDRLAGWEFPNNPMLAIQRDIFVFQCLIGCRVSDLRMLKRNNVVNGFIEYIPIKTIKERSDVVRVPLSAMAKRIVEKYKNQNTDRLLPFISDQKYNIAIKKMCRMAGIDRVVTIVNPTTGKDERHPIYEIASSHLARRTFIGNLYKRVKDPNLVGSLSGHKEGSKAFARYRDIDDDMKRELISLIG